VSILRTWHLNLHRVGGDGEFALTVGEAAVAVGSGTVTDVVGMGVQEGLPVEVVGVVDNELGDGSEVRLEAVEVADVCGQRDMLDVVVGGASRMAGVQLADRLSWIP
jgi:hypothetical protein